MQLSFLCSLEDVAEQYLVTAPFLAQPVQTESQTRFIRANLATLLVMKELYDLEGFPESDFALWKTVRDKVVVGLVKETQQFGNTSVSMHLATKCT